MSTTPPSPVCFRPGCEQRVVSWAPVWRLNAWRDDQEPEQRWLTTGFCAEHGHEALADAVRRRVEELVRPYPLMRHWTFDTYPADDDRGRAALAEVQEWRHAMWDGTPRLLITGRYGSGKTGLAFSCARAEVEDAPYNETRFCNVRQLLATVRRSYRAPEAADPTDDLAAADLLVLDDLGSERVTDWARETVAWLIEERYVRELPTIVTSNYRPSELAKRLGHDDPVTGLRIVSRLTENAAQIRLDRPDLRRRAT